MGQEKPARGKKEEAGQNGPGWAVYAGLGAVVLLAAVLLGLGYFTPRPPAEQPGQVNATGLSSPAAKLLLSSFDRGDALKDYLLDYREIENGVESRYQLARSGNRSWVLVQGGFGQLEGFFGADNSTDVLCLAYDDAIKCAMEGNDSEVKGIADRLKVLLPDGATYVAQKKQYADLISAGAIIFDGGLVEEKVGAFTTQKISYALSYRGLTVNQLLSLGIPPDNPNVATYADQRVSFWVDRGTGLVVRSLATWADGLKKESYERIYSKALLGNQALPAPPSQLVQPKAFARFYQGAVEDYVARETCAAHPTQEGRDACFKGEAVGRGSVELCRRIIGRTEFENCALIVAQSRADAAICGNLTMLGDDCLIAVASQNGDFGLCRRLANTSLSSQCIEAATEGARKAAEQEEQARRLAARKNCAADSDCAVFGGAGQYCLPVNSTGQFANGTGAADACFAGLPCGCLGGFCGFAKDDAYYSCVDAAETAALEDYIRSLAAEAEKNRAANSTNSSG